MIYVGVIIALSLASYWRVLTFTFWKDDWFLLWGAIHDSSAFRAYWAHPGTVVEFMWLTRLFGARPLLWNIVGLGLHIGVALVLALCVREFTRSKRAAKTSGLLYAVSVAGMDAVGWPSAHVVLWVSLFLLVGLYYYFRKHTALSLLYIFLALFSDPFRAGPIIFIYPGFVLVALATVPFFWPYIMGSQLMTHISLYVHNPMEVLRKIYVIGNYFNSLAHVFFGWIVPFREDGSTGVYNPIWARVGFLLLGIGLLYRKNMKVFILLLWIGIFYIPNWLFEPRLTMGVTHRYMAISELGFVAILSYVLSLVKNQTVFYMLLVILLVSNIAMTNYYALLAAPYRTATKVNALWDGINRNVPENMSPLLFSYFGEDPVKLYALSLSGAYPFAIARGITHFSNIPIVSEDSGYIQKLVCQDTVPLNHVYAWNVTNKGTMTDVTSAWRRLISGGCTKNR